VREESWTYGRAGNKHAAARRRVVAVSHGRAHGLTDGQALGERSGEVRRRRYILFTSHAASSRLSTTLLVRWPAGRGSTVLPLGASMTTDRLGCVPRGPRFTLPFCSLGFAAATRAMGSVARVASKKLGLDLGCAEATLFRTHFLR